jgi:hypothetical protein
VRQSDAQRDEARANRVTDADGLYLVTRLTSPVEEGGVVRQGPPSVDPLDPLGRPEAALELPGCPACQALPHLDAELVGWFATQSLGDGDGRQRLYAGGLCARHWRAVAEQEQARRGSMLGTAQVLAGVLSRRPSGEAPVVCPICEDLAGSATNRLFLLVTRLGPAALAGAPPSWRPCLPHLERLRGLRGERWLVHWVEERRARCLAEAAAAAHRYARTREQRHHHEATGSEAQDLLDALAALTGPTGP